LGRNQPWQEKVQSQQSRNSTVSSLEIVVQCQQYSVNSLEIVQC